MAALNGVKYVKKNCQIIAENKTKYTKTVTIVLNIWRQERKNLFLSVSPDFYILTFPDLFDF